MVRIYCYPLSICVAKNKKCSFSTVFKNIDAVVNEKHVILFDNMGFQIPDEHFADYFKQYWTGSSFYIYIVAPKTAVPSKDRRKWLITTEVGYTMFRTHRESLGYVMLG